jgi:hypothetical protein
VLDTRDPQRAQVGCPRRERDSESAIDHGVHAFIGLDAHAIDGAGQTNRMRHSPRIFGRNILEANPLLAQRALTRLAIERTDGSSVDWQRMRNARRTRSAVFIHTTRIEPAWERHIVRNPSSEQRQKHHRDSKASAHGTIIGSSFGVPRENRDT